MSDLFVEQHKGVGSDMTQETKQYLDSHFSRLEQRIIDITAPMKEKTTELRVDITDIYVRLGKTETAIAILEDNKGSRQTNTSTIIAIVFGVVMGGLAILGFLL